MANWCDNTLTITGDKNYLRQMHRALKRHEGDPDTPGLFGFVLPEPDYDTTPVARAHPEIKAKHAKTEEEKKEALENKPVVRPDNQWDWRVINWGSKWEPEYLYCDLTDTELCLSFASAWAPPTGIYQALTDKPEIESVRATYYEPGCDFVGCFEGGVDTCLAISKLPDLFFEKNPLGKELDEEYGIMSWRIECREHEEKEVANA